MISITRAAAQRGNTIVFPAWKDALSEEELHEMGEKFEDIEQETFGKHGFEDGVKQFDQALDFTDIGQFTAPPPPKA